MLHRAFRASPRVLHSVRTMQSASTRLSPLLSAEEALQSFRAAPQAVKFVDASWYMDKSRKPVEEFASAHLPRAAYFDIDTISDKSSSLPHMLPSPDAFSSHMDRLGISNDDHVIVYVNKGSFSAPRAWWTFKVFGHDNVSVLNGGLPAWQAAGGEVESGASDVSSSSSSASSSSTSSTSSASSSSSSSSSRYVAHFNARLIRDAASILQDIQPYLQRSSSSPAVDILDARSAGRFTGSEPEPRAGLAGGHIPGSHSLPFTQLLVEGDMTRFKSTEELTQVFRRIGHPTDVTAAAHDARTVVTSCGSGVTASVITFALHLLGRPLEKTPVYDGSWSEWGARDDLPKEL